MVSISYGLGRGGLMCYLLLVCLSVAAIDCAASRWHEWCCDFVGGVAAWQCVNGGSSTVPIVIDLV